MQSSRYARPAAQSGGNNANKSTGTPNRRQLGNTQRGVFQDGVWKCDCNPPRPADKFQVKKDNANKGRWFYTCQQEEGQRCGCFLWEDDAIRREKQTQSSILTHFPTNPQPQAPPAIPSIEEQTSHLSTPPKYVPPISRSAAATSPTKPLLEMANEYSPPSTSGTILADPEEEIKHGENVIDTLEALNSDEEEDLILAVDKAEAEAAEAKRKADAVKDDSVETPRKAPRTDTFSTPGAKRKFEETVATTPVSKNMATPRTLAIAEPQGDSKLATPPTTLGKRKFMDTTKGDSTGVEANASLLDDAFLDLVSPLSTPSRSVRRNLSGALQATLQSPSVSTSAGNAISVEEIAEVLRSEDPPIVVEEGMSLWKKLEQFCAAAARRTRGVTQSRDITRKALIARESRIVELEHRVRTLEAELDTEREIIKALREQGTE